MTEQGSFFYKGTFYDTMEAWEIGVKQYDKSRISHTSLYEMLWGFFSDLEVNLIQIRRSRLTNNEMAHLLSVTMIYILNKEQEIKEEVEQK